MMNIFEITEAQARQAMAEDEFGEDVRASSPMTAVILTQGWCPQWVMMNGWLKSAGRKDTDDGLELDVHILVYDRVPYSGEFTRFKEQVFGNNQIPYVRYYKNGTLIDETNYLSKKHFLAVFKKGQI